MPRHPFALLFLALAAISGCTETVTAQEFSGARSPTFATYCTGILAHATMLLSLQQGEAWSGDGTTQAPGGTTFLLSAGVGQWEGFVLEDDGTPRMLSTGSGLVLDADFTSDCAPDGGPPSSAVPVLLADTELYPESDLSGTECTVPAGTSLDPLGQDGGSTSTSPVELSSPRIQVECGVATMYTGKLALGQLVPR